MEKLFSKKNKIKILSIMTFAIMVTVSFLCAQDTYAGIVKGCNEYNGYCDCNSSCGAAWINGDPNASTYNVLEVEDDQDFAVGYLHGAVKTVKGAADAGDKNTASHTAFIDGDWPEGESSWPVWQTYNPVVDARRVDYMWLEANDDFGRGIVSSDGWSWIWDGWGEPSARVKIDVKKFISGAWVEDTFDWEDDDGWYHIWTKYARDVYIYRCYYPYDGYKHDSVGNPIGAGCGTGSPTTIFISQIQHYPPGEDNYRTYFDGKVALNNNGGSPLFRSGEPFTNSAALCRYSDTACSGWEDGWFPELTLDLHTPKDSGQSLSSTFQLRYTHTGWEGTSLRQWSELYSPHYVYNKDGDLIKIEYWRTRYNFRSGLTNTSGSGVLNYDTSGFPFGYEADITPPKSKTLSIPYGTDLTFTETMSYNHASNKATCRHIRKPIKDSGPPVEFEEYDECRWPSSNGGESRNRKITTTIHNPYNFNTKVETDISGGNGSTVLGGSTINLRLTAELTPKINPNINEYPYYTKVPSNTRVTAARFILNQNVTAEDMKKYEDVMKEKLQGNMGVNTDICTYVRNNFRGDLYTADGNDCDTFINKGADAINNSLVNVGEKITNGQGSSTIPEFANYSAVVPDIDDGNKYCVVVALFHTDSGGGYMSNMNNNWHISNISCRTIARVPSVQVWGNTYTGGGIKTTTTKKIPGANITTPPSDQNYLFGSWGETFALANGTITDFGTGASIGYSNDGRGGLAVNNEVNYCDIANMTIANSDCKSNRGGNAGNVVVSNENFLSQFVSRYTTTNTGSLDQVTSDVKYYKANGSATINDTAALQNAGYRLGNGVINVNDGTIIYQVDGDLTISQNICTGYPNTTGQCSNGLNEGYIYGTYNLDNIKRQYAAGTDRIPQIILIASGDVKIEPNVTEIDAWIYAGGTIKTCNTAGNALDVNACNNPLIVHGPVFAKKLELRRTYGAYGSRIWDWLRTIPTATNNKYFDKYSFYLLSGSATSAEIFNLRSDVYQWIYQQIRGDGDTITNIRYMRELAPRY